MRLESLIELVLPEERRYLGLILLVALLGHVGAFFLFKVPALPSLRQPKAPLQVVFWGADSGEGSGLDGAAFRVMEVRDPRAAILPPDEPVRAFASRLPVLRGLEEGRVERGPDRWLAEDLPSYGERILVVGAGWEPVAMPVVVESPPALRGSSWVVSGDLAGREVTRRPVLGRPEVDAVLGVTVIRVTVGGEGLVVSARVAESSGSFEVDRQGLMAVRGMVFVPTSGGGLVDGTVTIFWDYGERGAFLEPAGATP